MALDSSRDATPSRFYRPELDALRFLAFLLVFVEHTLRNASLAAVLPAQHLSSTLQRLGSGLALIGETGNFGMCLFFVLSAFLITELLLLERSRTGTIDIAAFYIRRILRIWPLYFGFLALAFVIGLIAPPSYLVTGRQLAYYSLLSGNWYFIFGGSGPAWLTILWSISVEEQFYLLWPGIVKAGRGAVGAGAGIVSFTTISVLALFWLGRHGPVNSEAVWFNSFVQFLFFAAGAAIALIIHRRGIPRFSTMSRALLLFLAFATWIVAQASFHIRKPGAFLTTTQSLSGYSMVMAGTVLLFLAVLGIHADRIPRWLRTMGKVSYGLYVFHDVCLSEVAHLLALVAHHFQLHGPSIALVRISVAPLALAVTIAMALLSYKYFESPFLRLRQRFTLVPSRPV